MKERELFADSNDPMDYVRIALALETLAYHDNNYLDIRFCDNKRLNEEIQLLLMTALRMEG